MPHCLDAPSAGSQCPDSRPWQSANVAPPKENTAMTTHSVETFVNAPKHEVWAALTDIGGVAKYNPTVLHSYTLTESNSGVGAERHCDLTFSGASVEERVTDWDESGSYSIEVFNGEKMPPIDNVVAHISVEAEGEDSVVRGTLEYDTRYGPVGWLMDRFMVAPKFGRAFAGIFAGLKHHVETGELVGSDTSLPYEKVDHTAV